MLKANREKIYKFLDLLIEYNIPFSEEQYIINQMKEETIDKILMLSSREKIIHLLTKEINEIKDFYKNYRKWEEDIEPIYIPSIVDSVDFYTLAGTYKCGLRKLEKTEPIIMGELEELNPDSVINAKLEKLKKL